MKIPKTRGCDLDGVLRRIFEESVRDKQKINEIDLQKEHVCDTIYLKII